MFSLSPIPYEFFKQNNTIMLLKFIHLLEFFIKFVYKNIIPLYILKEFQ